MLKRLMSLFLCFVLLLPITAYGEDINISAYSAIVMDLSTKSVFYEHNAYDELAMASTTKIMTCLIACESKKLNKTVTITQNMLDGVEGTMIYVRVGDKITLLDLIKGALLASGNDAANAIAVFIAGSKQNFVKLMNEKAKRFGMAHTNFVTPSGLDDEKHYSTAYDMAVLASYALKNDTFASICSLKSADISINGKKQTIYNHNRLLSYSSNYIGVKTGYTQKAGRCLISAYNYCSNIIIVVTLGAPNDWADHQRLVEYAQTKYNNINKTDNFELPVVGGVADSVRCSASYNLTTLGDVTQKVYFYPFLYAPLKVGDKIGKEEIYVNNSLAMTVDITVRKEIKIWQTITK